jgi:electron-transferring-flavoprotein dehydrogenase
MKFDLLIVGGGPAGLATACRIKQLTQSAGREFSVCVIEKGAYVGAHSLSGAVFDSQVLSELFPDWQDRGAPVTVPARSAGFHILLNPGRSFRLPDIVLPLSLNHQGNHVISLGDLCAWLAQEATKLGVQVFLGFAATDILFEEERVVGVKIGEKGRSRTGSEKAGFTPSLDVKASYTVFAEGSAGFLSAQLIDRFELAADCLVQHYAVGFKELWRVEPVAGSAGCVIHTLGWPLGREAVGGGFLYYMSDDTVAVGLVVDLSYESSYMYPYAEFQRYKSHKLISAHLSGGERIAYGARTLTKGGFYSLPRMGFPGGFLIGCAAGTLNPGGLKGIHTAIKSGLLAADSIFECLVKGGTDGARDCAPEVFQNKLHNSWIWDELYASRNVIGSLHKFGTLLGGVYNAVEQKLFRGHVPWKLQDAIDDWARMKPAIKSRPIKYPDFDNKYGFNMLSSLVLANIEHREDQPRHLKLADEKVPIVHDLPVYASPALRFCSAGVFEVKTINNQQVFVVNTQNCVHCKVCTIKDPSQNIVWHPPEGASGPNYRNM